RWPRAPQAGSPDEVTVSIRHHEHLSLDVPQMRFGDEPATFTMTPLPTVRGRVTDAVTGAPVSRFTVTAGYKDPDNGRMYWNTPDSVSGASWNTPESVPGGEGTYASDSLARWAT